MSDFRAHAESTDIEKIEGLLKAGLYISNTMLVMERNLETPFSDDSYISEQIEIYNSDDLSEYLAANEKGFGMASDPDMIAEELANPDSRIYVIRKRNKIVSSATVWNYDDVTVSIENIFTVPSYRNRHFASDIFSFALEEAVNKGMKLARLTVYGDDTEAISMYHKFGFSVTKVLQEFME